MAENIKEENPDSTNKTFVLSDESLNSYGFWIKTSGIDLKQFKRNPVMLWNHSRSWRGTKDELLPIGIWVNIRIEDGILKADAAFDKDDEFAAEIARKVASGVIRMCSVGVEVVEDTEDVNMLKSGQRRRTVTKCKLTECSITPFGANENAIALYKKGKLIELTDGSDIGVEFLNNNNKKMEQIALSLGLPETATMVQVLAKIEELKMSEKAVEQLKVDKEKVEGNYISQAIDAAVKQGKLTATSRDHYEQIGKEMGIDFLTTTLSALTPRSKPSEAIMSATGDNADKKFKDYMPSELESMRVNQLDIYKKLYKSEYGIELK